MQFTWDPKKDELNFEKHDMYFEFAKGAFYDPAFFALGPEIEGGEYRCRLLGMVSEFVLFVAYTFELDLETGEELIRLISARRATRSERRRYHEGD